MTARGRTAVTASTGARRARLRKILVGLFLLPFAAFGLIQGSVLLRFDAADFSNGAATLLARSRQIREGARPSYQENVLATLHPNAFNGPVFRLDDSSPEPPPPSQERGAGAALDTDYLLALEFDEPDNPGLVFADSGAAPKLRSGALRIRPAGGAYLTSSSQLHIPRSEIGEFAIRARAMHPSRLTLGWHADQIPRNIWTDSVDIDLIPDGEFHTYVLTATNVLRRNMERGDVIRRLLLRSSQGPRRRVDLDYLRIISKQAKYQRHRWGTDYEVLGGEMRRVLYMLPDSSLDYEITLPEREPRLELGMAPLLDGAPLAFQVSLTPADANSRVTLLDRRLPADDENDWRDERIDLTRWAGRKVTLSLSVRGSEDNVALWSNPCVRGKPNRRFNVILLLEDTLRADHLSTYGYGLETSLERDRILKQGGVVFRHAVSQATATRPSVPALMTSLLPTQTGVWSLRDVLDGAYLTMAEILRAQGFATAAFVQNGNAGPDVGLHQGFSELLDAETLVGGPEGVLGHRLEAWLEDHRASNFFLYLHILDPHGPYDPPPPFDHWYRRLAEQELGEPEFDGREEVETFDYRVDPPWVDRPTLEGRRLRYDGEIRNNDARLAFLFELLERLGIDDETLVVLASDHGEHLGERGEWAHHPPGYLQAVHVPLMMIYPGRFPEFRTVDPVVQLIDIMPTVLELAGVQSNGLLLMGDSLVGLADGEQGKTWRDRIAVSEEPTFMTREAPYVCGSLFYRGWHLISSRSFPSPFGKRSLPPRWRLQVYDYRNRPTEDRLERSFLADVYVRKRYARIMRELQANGLASWEKWTARSPEARRFDPVVRDRLRALGYLD